MNARDIAARAAWAERLRVEAMTSEEREAHEESLRPKQAKGPESESTPVKKVPLNPPPAAKGK